MLLRKIKQFWKNGLGGNSKKITEKSYVCKKKKEVRMKNEKNYKFLWSNIYKYFADVC